MCACLGSAALARAQQPPAPRDTTASPSLQDTIPLTLDDALREARAANAALPVAAYDVAIARTDIREGEASRWPRLSLESNAAAGGPLAYTTSQGLLQLVADDTLYSGGKRRANLRAARFRVQAAGAGARIAEKDVDLAVRLRYSEFVMAEQAVAFRVAGIERLRSYLGQIVARRAAGQPVASDVLTAQVRLGTEEAALEDARRSLDFARLQLNDLMGRDPATPLAVAPLPPPLAPAPASLAPWTSTPEMQRAAANRAAAEAGIASARAERRPQLSVSANLGVLPTFGDTNAGTGINSGTGFGGAVPFSLALPIWDAGVYGARVERATLQAQQARASEVLALRQSRLSWQAADAERTRLYAQVQAWERNVPRARDAYLQMVSMYSGGAVTTLEVLDAYTAWIDASAAYADALLRYRQAEATALRWGTP